MKKVKLIAVLAAILAAVLIFFFLNTLSNSGKGETTQVITAAVSIPSNTRISEEMLIVSNIPNVALVSGYISEKTQAIDKISNSEIFPGEQILTSKLIAPGEIGSDTLSYAISPGMRAITISVSETTGLSGMLKPQNRIDLICDFEYQQDGMNSRLYSILVTENIKILAVDNVLSEAGKTGQQGTEETYTAITLEVTPKQVLDISMAESSGQLRAALRSPLDEDITNLPNITIENVMAN